MTEPNIYDNTLDPETTFKRRVGIQAVEQFINSNMAIGLGSGSTAIWVVRHLAKLYKEGRITNIRCVSTGPGTQLEALKEGLPIFDLNAPDLLELDLTIDGADEYDAQANLMKGGGGCLLQEKIVAYSSKKFVVGVSEEKRVSSLGHTFPLPIEVIPFALRRVEKQLKQSYEIKSLALRMDAKNIGPWITGEGNYIFDVVLGLDYDPCLLEREIVQIVGVVETGFFTQHKPTLMMIKQDGTIDIV